MSAEVGADHRDRIDRVLDGRRRLVLWVLAVLLALVLAVASRAGNAGAQTADLQVSSFPGATVTVEARPGQRVVRSLVTSCPDGYEAMAGGWSASPGLWQVIESFPSQRPSVYGPGQWTLTVAVAAGRLTITPYVVCLGGTTQLPG
jgi:hypothetical protein